MWPSGRRLLNRLSCYAVLSPVDALHKCARSQWLSYFFLTQFLDLSIVMLTHHVKLLVFSLVRDRVCLDGCSNLFITWHLASPSVEVESIARSLPLRWASTCQPSSTLDKEHMYVGLKDVDCGEQIMGGTVIYSLLGSLCLCFPMLGSQAMREVVKSNRKSLYRSYRNFPWTNTAPLMRHSLTSRQRTPWMTMDSKSLKAPPIMSWESAFQVHSQFDQISVWCVDTIDYPVRSLCISLVYWEDD